MFQNLINLVKQLFKKVPQSTSKEMQDNERFAREYADITGINVRAMANNKIAGVVVNGSKISVHGADTMDTHTKRVDLLDDALSKFIRKKWKNATADVAGNGGVFILPILSNGQLGEDIVPQSRVVINREFNGKITDMTIIVDKVTIDYDDYWLMRDMMLINGLYYEQYKVTQGGIDGKDIPIETVPKWQNIQPITPKGKGIPSDRLLMGYAKCPVSARNNTSAYGVPLTYGADEIIKNIQQLNYDFMLEYKNKKAFVGLDSRLLDDGNKTAEGGLFRLMMNSGIGNELWEVFDPPFRDMSYVNAIEYQLKMLERSIGVSEGFFTQPKASAITATEVKARNQETFILQDAFRVMWEDTIKDLVYSYNVIANVFGITPPSEYLIDFDWSYDLIENTDVAWQQQLQAETSGVISKEEVRQWLKPNETIEESRQAIEKIQAIQQRAEMQYNE